MQLNDNKKRDTHTRGISLVELMLYITFAFVVITFAMSLVTEAAQFYVRGREVSKIQSNGRYAMAILARDVMNTGFKTILVENAGVLSVSQFQGTWTGSAIGGTPPLDSAASFLFSPGDPADTLEIFKLEMENTDATGDVIRARYALDTSRVLWRITRIYDASTGTWGAGDTLALSSNIESFQCRFSNDGVNWVDNPTGIRHQIVAIQLELLMRTDREVDGTTAQSYTLGNITFIPPTGSERFLRRRYTEIVEVVNNGKLY